MSWCKYCKDSGGFFSTSYTCELNNEYIPSVFVEDYCKYDYKIGNCPWYKKYDGRGCASPCFITTVSCGILGKDDNDDVLNNLRKFRDNILQKDYKYVNVLKMYDSIGPIISCKLMHDKEKLEKSKYIYSKLKKLTNLIENKEYDNAINNYIIMVLKLVSIFGLDNNYRQIRDNNFGYDDGEFDKSTAGHGKRLLK